MVFIGSDHIHLMQRKILNTPVTVMTGSHRDVARGGTATASDI